MIVFEIAHLISNRRLLDPAPRNIIAFQLPVEPAATPGHPALTAA
jgi:hypothetical protein